MRRYVALVVLLALTGCAAFRTAAAVVNGRTINEDAFHRKLDFLAADPRFASQFPGEQGKNEKRNLARQLLTFLIHQEIVTSYAESNRLEVPTEDVDARLAEQIEGAGGDRPFRRQLAEAGAAMSDVRDLIEEQVLREVVARAVVGEEVPDERLREEYEKRAPQYTQVHVAHILVEDQALAEELAGRATPQNFADLARESSVDTGSAEQGGDLGTRPASEYVEPFGSTTLQIPVGEIGGPIETEFGFHVIHVIERTAQPFEEVREQLLSEFGQEFFTNWLLARVRGAEILVNPRYGQLDRKTAEVVERRSTTPEAPAVQVTP